MTTRVKRYWLFLAIWAAAFVPLAIVAHEAAHYVGYVIYDMPKPTLSYASGGFEGMREYWEMLREGRRADAEAIVPVGSVGMSALFGPLATIVMGLAGLWLLLTRQSIIGAALAVAAFFRALPIALLYAMGNELHTDEAHIAITLGIPGMPIMLVQLGGLLVSLWLITRAFTWRSLVAVLAASSASLAIWMTALGPLVLPE